MRRNKPDTERHISCALTHLWELKMKTIGLMETEDTMAVNRGWKAKRMAGIKWGWIMGEKIQLNRMNRCSIW